jgi:hypothetical protein
MFWCCQFYGDFSHVIGTSLLPSTAEPDQALVAKKDGYCYGVFRGTTLTVDDWSQNLQIGSRNICGSDATNGGEAPAVCCTVRSGFYDAYHTDYYQGKLWDQNCKEKRDTLSIFRSFSVFQILKRLFGTVPRIAWTRMSAWC